MDRSFWLEKWNNGQIGFHLGEVHPDLVAQAPEFLSDGPHRVLVPLCGKSIDLHWLAEAGHQVTGVELSDTAARAFHDEHDRTATRRAAGPFTEWSSSNLRFLVGDIMQLEGSFDRVWDRAAMVALPPDLRAVYVETVRRVASGGELLLVTFDYDTSVMSGPPFAIPADEVRAAHPEAELVMSRDIIEDMQPFRQRGHHTWLKQVWRVPLP